MSEPQTFALTHRETIIKEKTWNSFYSTSTYQYRVLLSTEFHTAWCLLPRVNDTSFFFLPGLFDDVANYSAVNNSAQRHSESRRHVVTESHNYMGFVPFWKCLNSKWQKQMESNVRASTVWETWNSDSTIHGESFLLRHGIKVPDRKWQQDF